VAPRIPPVREPDAEQRDALAKTLQSPDGTPLNIFATLAHIPRLMGRVNALGGYFMVHGRIGERDRELAILRTAAHARSEYEIAQHRLLGARAGLRPTEIESALDLRSDGSALPPDDRALLRFVDEVIRHGTVSDAAWDGVAGKLDQLQRLELLLLVGYYRMIAGFLNGIGVEIEPALLGEDGS
jgi:4-carboxymuconolactone decarboxylase